METNIIKNIELKGLFDKYSLHWKLNEDVNILVGINGSGKTTVIRSIDALLSKNYRYFKDKSNLKTIGLSIMFQTGKVLSYDNPKKLKQNGNGKINHTLITTFDIPIKEKGKIKQSESPLDKELHDLWYSLGTEQPSFFNYRLKATNFPEEAKNINHRIRRFFSAIDKLFSETNKHITINPVNNEIIFKRDDSFISLTDLSSGEKQLLLILLNAFLMEEKPYILLMDEPEISLHITWQQQLIDIIRDLNPNCQIIISTHSPSIFGTGWGDKMFFTEDLLVEE